MSIQTLPKESTLESSAADVVEEKEAGHPNEELLMDAVLQETSDAATSVEHGMHSFPQPQPLDC